MKKVEQWPRHSLDLQDTPPATDLQDTSPASDLQDTSPASDLQDTSPAGNLQDTLLASEPTEVASEETVREESVLVKTIGEVSLRSVEEEPVRTEEELPVEVSQPTPVRLSEATKELPMQARAESEASKKLATEPMELGDELQPSKFTDQDQVWFTGPSHCTSH